MKNQEELSEGNRLVVESLFNLTIPDAIWEKHGVEMSEITHKHLESYTQSRSAIEQLILLEGGLIKEMKVH